MKIQDIITETTILNALSYDEYRKLIDDLLRENKVTGNFMDNSDEILSYTKMNVARMRRGDKTSKINFELEQAIKKIDYKQIWLVITEGWCGDAAQLIPTIAKITELNDNIELKFILRDENPNIMNAYLTDGGKAIPKLIMLDAKTLNEINNWGPRPNVPQQMTVDFKNDDSLDYTTYVETLHKWFANDKYQSIQNEILTLLSLH